MRRMTGSIGYRVGKAHEPGKGARILVVGHPDEQEALLERVAAQLLEQQDAVVYFFEVEEAPAEEAPAKESPEEEAPEPGLTSARIAEVVDGMQLVVALVTRRMLTEPNPAMDALVPYALAHNVAVLPLVMEPAALPAYPRRFGDLQYLMPDDSDPTALPFAQKLAAFLAEVLVTDEVAQRVRDAFDALVFLSYRKRDRAFAAELMRMIHRNPHLRDVAFWYDEFLVPGEDFNDGIRQALDKSDLFALVVTPNLLENPNYVLSFEYPAARAAKKGILPFLMRQLSTQETRELELLYRGMPRRIDATTGSLPDDGRLRRPRRLVTRRHTDDAQHTFLIGLAYLDGINMEVDLERAVGLITQAAEAGLEEAMRKLSVLYATGKGVTRSAAEAVAWQRRLRDAVYERFRRDESDENLADLYREQNALANRLHAAKMVRELYPCLYEQKRWAEEELARGFADARHQLAVSACKLAEVCAMVGQTWEGVEYCWESVAHLEVLLAQEPSDPARKDAYIACRTLGQIYAQRQNWASALGMYRLARERLHAVGDPAYADSLAKDRAALWRLEGESLHWLGAHDEAAACFERAREESEAAYARQPDARSRRTLINTYDQLVGQCRRRDEHDAARAYLLRERELVEEELAEARELGLRTNALLVELGCLHEELGEEPEATRCYRAALETPEEDPDAAQSLETRVSALRALERLSRKVGLGTRAKALFGEMCAVLRQLYEGSGAPEYLQTLADELEWKAGLDDATADVALLEEAFDVRQELVTRFYSLDTRARRDRLRDRLDRVYELQPGARRTWVMVCEPSDADRAEIVAGLERCGCRVALSVHATREFDRPFTEMRAEVLVLGLRGYCEPELSELQFMRRSLDPSARVICVVDEGTGELAEAAREAGAAAVVERPVVSAALERAVQAVLRD